MTKGFTAETNIHAAPDTVWTAITDFARMPEWMPGVTAVEPVDDTPLCAGKVFSIRLETRGRGSHRTMTLAEWDPPRRFALSSKEGSVNALYSYEIEPDGAETRVRLHGTCTAGSLFMKLLHPLIVRMMTKHDSRQVTLLKQMVEQLG